LFSKILTELEHGSQTAPQLVQSTPAQLICFAWNEPESHAASFFIS